ncbi:MAG: mandelate racemase/muconate lactonizing enzyme family protein [Methylobacteriaceae bacterium]|nr:mandelate racemase/muconate lactonizing enzyme family protein [Methylobacteriaceae bacterium]
MKIVRLDTFPVSIPYRHAERSARVQRGGVSDVVIRLTTDMGLVGWGESCSGADTASIEAAVRAMAPFVVGRDPWESEAIAREVYRTGLWDYRVTTGNFAFAGIDMALWDLCGKDCGKPLYKLFGGALRSRVSYFFYLAAGDPDDVVDQCRAGVERGYDCFYLKVGVDARAEEAMLSAIRATIGPDRSIRVDANEAWSLAQASHLLSRWNDRYGIDCAEAPVKAFPLSLMARLRQHVPVALCANEGLGSESDVVRMIESASADVLCFSSYWVGTLRRFHTLSHLAHLHGIGVCKHTHGEFGIAAAAGHHMLLGLPNVVDGSQQTAAMMADDVLVEPLPIAQGPHWGLIDRPGLGIEVDEAKLRHYHESYRRDGQFLPWAA